MRILVAEDDQIAASLLENTLCEWGYEVDVVANGREAIDRLEQTDYRLVICDWQMPEVSGLELCRHIRANRQRNYVYILMLTSRSGSDDVVDGLSAGADEFLTKPFNPNELEVRLRIAQRILSLESREMMIFALAKLAESRDPETGMHLERIQEYSRALAIQLSHQVAYADEITEEYIELIYLTSPLHDIGKVGIPDGVLLKPGPLSDTEFEIMKRHARIGAETLDALLKVQPDAPYLLMAREIAATHHERFDGTGYPLGMSGQDIPLCGRIVALADVYDALTTKRVYKPAYSHDVARATIVEGRGTHFDPGIVDAFLAIEKQFVEIRRCLDGTADFDFEPFNPELLLFQ